MHVGGKHFFLWKIGGFSLACSRKKNLAFSSLRKNCPNTKYFCFVFSPDTGKYGLKKSPYLDTFHAVVQRSSTWSLIH